MQAINQIKSSIQAGVGQATRLATVAGNEIQRSAQENNVNSPLPSDFPSEVHKAANILSTFTDPEKNDGKNIPKEIIQKAKGLAIFTVLKAGFFWSGRLGSGLVVARLEDRWSSPSCISIGGLGFGMQVGADVTDYVVILNTPEAVKAFSRGENLTLGGNLSVSAGPVGLGGEVYGTVAQAPVALYSYSKSKGLFAGVSVEGTILIERKDANKNFYGKQVSAEEILTGKVEVPTDASKVLLEVIAKAE
ncbi:hypothetical protein G9A89_023700 [Geosiphon pyriformis]|nr:hypothetical protein G9A89_023700 [Geosiphon pyriformis]